MKLFSLLPLLACLVSASIIDRRSTFTDFQRVDSDVKSVQNALTQWNGSGSGFVIIARAQNALRNDLNTTINNLRTSPVLARSQCDAIVAYYQQPLRPDLEALLQAFVSRKQTATQTGLYGVLKNYIQQLRDLFRQLCDVLPTKCPTHAAQIQSICSTVTANFATATAAYS